MDFGPSALVERGKQSIRAFRQPGATSADGRHPLLDPRRQAGEPRSGALPFLYGLAPTPALWSGVRRKGFSSGESLCTRIQGWFACRKLLYAISARGETCRRYIPSAISPARVFGIFGRCLITAQLMSEMIGMIFQDGKRPINLLEQHHPRQFVRKCHPAQGDHRSGLPAGLFSKAVRSADCE